MNNHQFLNIKSQAQEDGSGRWLAIHGEELTPAQINELELIIREKQKETEERTQTRAKQKSSFQAWLKKLDAPKEVFELFNL